MGNSHSAIELLFDAVQRNKICQLESLLEQYGHDGEAKLEAINSQNKEGRTPLMIAASKNLPALCNKLLAHGADVHFINPRKNSDGSALHEATKRGHEAVVEQLLQAGACPFTCNSAQRTSADLAVSEGHGALLHRFIQLALFEGTVSLKCSSMGGLKQMYKRRYVVIVPLTPFHEGPPCTEVQSRKQMWVLKDASSLHLRVRLCLDGCSSSRIGDGGMDGVVRLHDSHDPPGGSLIASKMSGYGYCLVVRPATPVGEPQSALPSETAVQQYETMMNICNPQSKVCFGTGVAITGPSPILDAESEAGKGGRLQEYQDQPSTLLHPQSRFLEGAKNPLQVSHRPLQSAKHSPAQAAPSLEGVQNMAGQHNTEHAALYSRPMQTARSLGHSFLSSRDAARAHVAAYSSNPTPWVTSAASPAAFCSPRDAARAHVAAYDRGISREPPTAGMSSPLQSAKEYDPSCNSPDQSAVEHSTTYNNSPAQSAREQGTVYNNSPAQSARESARDHSALYSNSPRRSIWEQSGVHASPIHSARDPVMHNSPIHSAREPVMHNSPAQPPGASKALFHCPQPPRTPHSPAALPPHAPESRGGPAEMQCRQGPPDSITTPLPAQAAQIDPSTGLSLQGPNPPPTERQLPRLEGPLRGALTNRKQDVVRGSPQQQHDAPLSVHPQIQCESRQDPSWVCVPGHKSPHQEASSEEDRSKLAPVSNLADAISSWNQYPHAPAAPEVQQESVVIIRRTTHELKDATKGDAHAADPQTSPGTCLLPVIERSSAYGAVGYHPVIMESRAEFHASTVQFHASTASKEPPSIELQVGAKALKSKDAATAGSKIQLHPGKGLCMSSIPSSEVEMVAVAEAAEIVSPSAPPLPTAIQSNSHNHDVRKLSPPSSQQSCAELEVGFSGGGPPSRRASLDAKTQGSCVICMVARASAGFLHGTSVHHCVCECCSKMVPLGAPCPLCREPVERIIGVF